MDFPSRLERLNITKPNKSRCPRRLAQANPHASDYRPTLTWNKVSCGQYPPLCSGYSPCLIYDAP